MAPPRSYHKSWQNKRPGFTRRVRWFQGIDDVRLNFQDFDEGREAHCVYSDKETATKDYEDFIAGASVADMLDRREAREEARA